MAGEVFDSKINKEKPFCTVREPLKNTWRVVLQSVSMRYQLSGLPARKSQRLRELPRLRSEPRGRGAARCRCPLPGAGRAALEPAAGGSGRSGATGPAEGGCGTSGTSGAAAAAGAGSPALPGLPGGREAERVEASPGAGGSPKS